MMSRHFSKIGLWFFMFAVAWYLTGNFLVDFLKKEKVAYYQSRHVSTQHASLGSGIRVLIHAPDKNLMTTSYALVFDPAATQVSIVNEDMHLATSMQDVDGVLHVNLKNAELPIADGHSNVKTEIRLPSSVSKVEIVGGSIVDMSGSMPAPAAELMLQVSDCGNTVNMKQFSVNRLHIVANCQVPKDEKCCSSSFYFGEDVQISKLEVRMPQGSLDYSSSAIPQQTLLSVGDAVRIEGQRAFFETARFQAAAK